MKKALLDTNIIIHREANTVSSPDIGTLYRWLERGKYTKCVHSITINEIKKNHNKATVDTFLVKLENYEKIEISSPLQKEVQDISEQIDKTENDVNDSLLLNEVFIGRVDILITEDKNIHRKAERLNIPNKVFSINSFLEKVFIENPGLVDYKVLSIRKRKFGEISLYDPFFDSLKEDYSEFEKWFVGKYDDEAYITINSNKGRLLSFLYLKIEDRDEDYSDITPQFPPKKRLKIGTFKVISNGLRLGERFLKIIFDNALINKVEEIYVTIFDKREEQKKLILLLGQWGFKYWGYDKRGQSVYVRNFDRKVNISQPKLSYPYVSGNQNVFMLSIYPKYHTDLFPDSILRTESPENFDEDSPHRNGIRKAYVSWAVEPHLKAGDILVFYRTGGKHKGVITTMGVVEELRDTFKGEEDFVSYCKKSSVFSERELRTAWRRPFRRKPFVVSFLGVYSFPHRINLNKLVELKILKGIGDAPHVFKLITKDQLKTIVRETKSDDSFIIY